MNTSHVQTDEKLPGTRSLSPVDDIEARFAEIRANREARQGNQPVGTHSGR